MTRALYGTLVALLLLGCSQPLVASAQERESELLVAVRAAILSDPRSADMAPADIEAMALALTQQAESAGVTAEDIVWRPAAQGGGSADAPDCRSLLCSLNAAFGFDGSDYTIPIWLGACALMLIFLIASILQYHHYRHLHPIQRIAPLE